MAVLESDMNHDVFSFCYDEDYPSMWVPRGMWNETSLETADRCTNSPTLGIGETTSATFRIATDGERPRQCSFHKMRGSVYFRHLGYSEFLQS